MAQEIVERQPESEAGSIFALIERVARDKDLPIERLQQLMNMKREMVEREEAQLARREFISAMAQCQAEIPVILKNRKNDQTRSRYADLAAITKAAIPIITKHGFSITFEPAPPPEGFVGISLRYRLNHSGGHEQAGEAAIPMTTQGAKGNAVMTAVHAFGSAATYGRRYIICMLFNIATGDDDGNQAGQESDEPITVEQFDELRSLIEESGADEDRLLSYLRVERLDALTLRGYKTARQKLKAKIAEQAKANA